MHGWVKRRKSLKTTLGGVAAILTSAAGLATGLSTGDHHVIAPSISGIIAGVALLFARDNDVTSEEAGAKK